MKKLNKRLGEYIIIAIGVEMVIFAISIVADLMVDDNDTKIFVRYVAMSILFTFGLLWLSKYV